MAEYQRRGVVHFHAIIRLDGPAGPTTVPPAWATIALLTAAINQAAHAIRVSTPAAPGLPARTLAWGRQLDIRPVTASGDVTDTKVAGYVARYATKAAECTGTLDRRITPADRLADLPVRDHARRHIFACLRLGRLPQLKELRLAAWAHMLGFRGHFSTKSRAYSITRSTPEGPTSSHPATVRNITEGNSSAPASGPCCHGVADLQSSRTYPMRLALCGWYWVPCLRSMLVAGQRTGPHRSLPRFGWLTRWSAGSGDGIELAGAVKAFSCADRQIG